MIAAVSGGLYYDSAACAGAMGRATRWEMGVRPALAQIVTDLFPNTKTL